MPEKIVLDNGTILLIDPVKESETISIGLWVNIGSRDEKLKQQGFCHFIEHMLFKGTRKRNHYDIALEVDSMGGEINGLTDREHTVYLMNVASEYYKTALDILMNMFFCASFKRRDFQKEKPVILDEIELVQDNPDDYVFDLFSRAIWGDNPFGLPVTGSKEAIQVIRLKELKKFYRYNYVPNRMILSVAGRVNPVEFIKEVEHLFRIYKPVDFNKNQPVKRFKPISKPGRESAVRDIEQVYWVCGTESYSLKNDKRYPLTLLNMMLGNSFSSRLFQKIREKLGLCYSISSSFTGYSDTGEFTIFFSTTSSQFQYVLDAIDRELKLILKVGFSREEIEKAKSKFKGNYILAKESNEWKMTKMAIQELVYGRLIPFEETLYRIEKVKISDLEQVAEELLKRRRFSFAIIGPEKLEKGLREFEFSF